MQRHNAFTMIHKALRTMLYDTALTIQQTCFSNESEANTATTKLKTVLDMFEQHAEHEDNMVLPLLEVYEHELVQEFELEHVKDMELGNRLKHLLNILSAVTLQEEKTIVGSAISKSFVEFMVFNLEHMAKEEVLINQALWKHYTDEQLIMMNHKLAASIPPAEKALSAKWMMRGANNLDIISWLRGVRESAPLLAFQSLLTLLETEVPVERRETILQGLQTQELKQQLLAESILN